MTDNTELRMTLNNVTGKPSNVKASIKKRKK
jgi:hypothetical protein